MPNKEIRDLYTPPVTVGRYCLTNECTGIWYKYLNLICSEKITIIQKFEYIEVEVFWLIMPYSVVVGYQCFGGPCTLHQQQHSPLKCSLL